MIVLRSPKGWTIPDVVDGVQMLGTFRSHQVPLATVRENPATSACWRSGCGPTVPSLDDDGAEPASCAGPTPTARCG